MMLLVVLAGMWLAASECDGRHLSLEEMKRFYPPSSLDLSNLALLSEQPAFRARANTTLRAAAAKRGIYVGSAVDPELFNDPSDPLYAAVLTREYDLYTAENSCKFGPTEPQYKQFNFGDCDKVLLQAGRTSSAFRGHNFIWGQSNPDWLTKGGFSPSQLQTVLEEHIAGVGGRYGTHPLCWDVVNEAVADSGSSTFKPADPWYPAVPDYVDRAFIAARKATNGTQLFYNDYGAEGMNEKSNKIYQMVQSMRSRGIPVDGVGLQMHISVDSFPPFAEVAANMARLGALGLKVHVTEMDVRCDLPCGPDRLRAQAAIYGGMLGACLSTPACTNFETWGFTDKHTWLWDFQNPDHVNLQPLPFNTSYATKPAYDELLAVLTA